MRLGNVVSKVDKGGDRTKDNETKNTQRLSQRQPEQMLPNAHTIKMFFTQKMMCEFTRSIS